MKTLRVVFLVLGFVFVSACSEHPLRLPTFDSLTDEEWASLEIMATTYIALKFPDRDPSKPIVIPENLLPEVKLICGVAPLLVIPESAVSVRRLCSLLPKPEVEAGSPLPEPGPIMEAEPVPFL